MKTRFALLLTLALTTPAAHAQEAAEIWKQRCQSCHGPDGRAQTAVGRKEGIVDMSQPAWQKAQLDADIRELIAQGSPRNRKMKPYGGTLSGKELDALVTYIRTFKK